MRSHDDKEIDDKISPEKLESLTREQLIKLVRALENNNRVQKRIIDAQLKPTLSEISMFKKVVFMEPILGDISPIPSPPLRVSLGAPNMPPIQVKELSKTKPKNK